MTVERLPGSENHRLGDSQPPQTAGPIQRNGVNRDVYPGLILLTTLSACSHYLCPLQSLQQQLPGCSPEGSIYRLLSAARYPGSERETRG